MHILCFSFCGIESFINRIIKSGVLSQLCNFATVEFLDIQATLECRFTQKRMRDIIKTHSQYGNSLS